MAVRHLILGGGNRTPKTKLAMWETYRRLGISKVYLLDFLSSIREPFPEPVEGLTFIKPRSFFDFVLDVQCKRDKLSVPEFQSSGVFVFGGDSFAPRYYKPGLLRSVFDMFPVYGGSSAGAALAGNYVYGWDYDKDNHLSLCRGLGYLPFIIDTHFYERKRMDRMQLLPVQVVGINEDSFHTYQLSQRFPVVTPLPDIVLEPDH